MIRASVKGFEFFPHVTDTVEQTCRDALNKAARHAAQVAQEEASIDLQIDVAPAAGTDAGYAAGLKSRRVSDEVGKSTPIGQFFDKGTLGKRKRPPKRQRRPAWTVKRRGSVFVATRHDVDGKGISAERFYLKAHRAGRKKLIDELTLALHK